MKRQAIFSARQKSILFCQNIVLSCRIHKRTFNPLQRGFGDQNGSNQDIRGTKTDSPPCKSHISGRTDSRRTATRCTRAGTFPHAGTRSPVSRAPRQSPHTKRGPSQAGRPPLTGKANRQKRFTPSSVAIRKVAATDRMAYNSGKAARISVLPITS